MQHIKAIIPQDPLHALGSALLSLIGVFFPAEAWVYQAFATLIIFDTVTGALAAARRKAFNSRSLRTKLFSKVVGYAIVPGALQTVSLFLTGTGLEGFFALAAKFTLASIAFIELTSILENTGAIVGKPITLKLNAKELKDLMESNHVG